MDFNPAELGRQAVESSLGKSQDPQINQVLDSIRTSYTTDKKFTQNPEWFTPDTGLWGNTGMRSDYRGSSEEKIYDIEDAYAKLRDGSYVAKYDTYKSGRNNAEYAAANQSTGEKWLNGITKFAGQIGTGIVGGTIGVVDGVYEGIKQGSFRATYDNDFSNYLDDLNEKLDYKLPNYVSQEERDMSFFESMGTANFWAKDVLGGAAFTVSAIGSEAIWAWATGGMSLATTAARLAPKITRILGAESKIARGLKAYGEMAKAKALVSQPVVKTYLNAKLPTGMATAFGKAGEFANVARFTYTSAGFEAGMEARTYIREMKDHFEQNFEVKNGRKPTQEEIQEFNENLTSSANSLYGFNVAIVGSSNLLTIGRLFDMKSPLSASSKWVNSRLFGIGLEESAGKVAAKTASKLQNVAKYSWGIGKSPLIEGVWEEGMQSVGSNTAKNWINSTYDPKYLGTTMDVGDAFTQGLSDTYGTKEGMKEVGIGMIVGLLTGTGINLKTYGSLKGELKGEEKKVDNIVEFYDKYYSPNNIAETLAYSGRVQAANENADKAAKKGDFTGGELARQSAIIAQASHAFNLDYLDETIERTEAGIRNIGNDVLMKEYGVDEQGAEDLKEKLVQEYKTTVKSYEKNRNYTEYILGKDFTKNEREEFKDLGLSMKQIKDAVAYELTLGEKVHDFSNDLLTAIKQKTGETLLGKEMSDTLNIEDILLKAGKETKKEATKKEKELVALDREKEALEREYKEVEKTLFNTVEPEAKKAFLAKADGIRARISELDTNIENLTKEYTTLIKTANMKNPFGKNVDDVLISAQSIRNRERTLRQVRDLTASFSEVDPQKGAELQKLISEYGKSITAFKRYADLSRQLSDTTLGVRGRRNIISELGRGKNSTDVTVEFLTGLSESAKERAVDMITQGLESSESVQEVINNKKPKARISPPTEEEIAADKKARIEKVTKEYDDKIEALKNEEIVNAEDKSDVDNRPIPEQIAEKKADTESKIKRKDLFIGVGEFSSELGGSDKAAVPVSHKEINGIEFVEYAHPETGSVDVIVTGTSNNDFVGFYRIYENGKPTNKWSSKFENQSRNKDNFKNMISGVQEMLPEGHEYTEKTSISTDGLRVWNQQLEKGYELQYDENGNIVTNTVAINGDAIVNELGVDVNKGSFDNIRVTKEEFETVKKALLPYLEKLGLNESNIRYTGANISVPGAKASVQIDLPVLKKSKVATTEDIEQQIADLREQEQNEMLSEIPNIEDYKVINGKVDKTMMTTPVLDKYNEIYDRYDKLISPLLERLKQAKAAIVTTPAATQNKEVTDLKKQAENISNRIEKIKNDPNEDLDEIYSIGSNKTKREKQIEDLTLSLQLVNAQIQSIEGTTTKKAEDNTKKIEALEKEKQEKISQIENEGRIVPKVERRAIRNYILDLIKKSPYLFEYYGEDVPVMMTEEELNEYEDLAVRALADPKIDNKTISFKSPYTWNRLTPTTRPSLKKAEIKRLQELNERLANWRLLESYGNAEGISVSDMILQDIAIQKEVDELQKTEIVNEDFESVKNEDLTPPEGSGELRNGEILQNVEKVIARVKGNNFQMSHFSLPGLLERIQEEDLSDEVYYDEIDSQGKPVPGTEKTISVSEVGDNTVVNARFILTFSDGSTATVVIGKGGKVVLKTSEFEDVLDKANLKYQQGGRVNNSTFGDVYDLETGTKLDSDYADIEGYSPTQIYNMQPGSRVSFEVNLEDEFNRERVQAFEEAREKFRNGEITQEEFRKAGEYLRDHIKIDVLDSQKQKVSMLKANYDIKDKNSIFLLLRNQAFEKVMTNYDGNPKVTLDIESSVKFIFLGSPNYTLDENGRVSLFDINPERVEDFGYYDNGKLVLKNGSNTSTIRTDFLRKFKNRSNVPIVVFKQGNVLVAFPVALKTKSDIKMGTEFLENIDPSKNLGQVALELNALLEQNGLSPIKYQLYFAGSESQTLFNDMGDMSSEFAKAIQDLDSLPQVADVRDWMNPEFTKDNLVEDIQTPFDLNNDPLSSAKPVIDLGEDGVVIYKDNWEDVFARTGELPEEAATEIASKIVEEKVEENLDTSEKSSTFANKKESRKTSTAKNRKSTKQKEKMEEEFKDNKDVSEEIVKEYNKKESAKNAVSKKDSTENLKNNKPNFDC
jgi:hypothetical protein